MGTGQLSEFLSIVNPHWSKIVYTGELKKEQVFDFYQLADIGVIPSFHEQCSFTAIEMRMHKLPLIVSSVDGLDELFTHEKDSLKLTVHLNKKGEKRLDEKEFADYLARLLSDKKLSSQLARTSYKKAIRMFNDKIMHERYEKVVLDFFN